MTERFRIPRDLQEAERVYAQHAYPQRMVNPTALHAAFDAVLPAILRAEVAAALQTKNNRMGHGFKLFVGDQEYLTARYGPRMGHGFKLFVGDQEYLTARYGPAPETPAAEVEKQYPCADCGALRTKAEGGTTFTVCEECWERHRGTPQDAAPTFTREAEACVFYAAKYQVAHEDDDPKAMLEAKEGYVKASRAYLACREGR